VSASADDTDISGYLSQYKSRNWKRLWFVVKDRVLYTFKASEVVLNVIHSMFYAS